MKTIEENNLMIAGFMGYPSEKRVGGLRFLINQYWTLPSRMKYNTSWDWLMPVVEKIEATEMGSYIVSITDTYCAISDGYSPERPISTGNEATKIEATYAAVIAFINWYKETHNQL